MEDLSKKFKEGQKCIVHLPWVDSDCWVTGTVLGTTAKRVKVDNDVRGVGYYVPQNVKLREEETEA